MVQLEDQADEYSRSSLLFPLLFPLPFFLFLPLLSLLSRRSTSVLAREPEKPEVEWHKIGRKKWGEKGKRRKESRGKSETSDQFFTHYHFYAQFRLSKKLPSWQSRSTVAPSPLIGHDSLRENKNWRGLGTIEETARFVLIRRNLISTE